MRRPQLLEAERFENGWVQVTTWKNTKPAKHGPFQKLMALLLSDLRLLERDRSSSTGDIVKILQRHVSSVDTFLERTDNDFTCAINDIEERIRYLQFPLAQSDVFDAMLNGKKYRTQLLQGNEKVDKIVDRTTTAMKSVMADIDGGIHLMAGLSVYLERARGQMSIGNRQVSEVLSSMHRNEQGWTTCLKKLRTRGIHLSDRLLALSCLTSDISRRAGVASRRNMSQSTAVSPVRRVVSPGVRSKFAKEPTVHTNAGAWVNKPLPQEPRLGASSPEPIISGNTSPEESPIELECTRSQVPLPASSGSPTSDADRSPARLESAGTPQSVAKGDDTIALSRSFLLLAPLRSNPPECAKSEVSSGQSVVVSAIAQTHSVRKKMTTSTRTMTHAQFRRSIGQPITMINARAVLKAIDSKPVAVCKDQKGQMDTSFVLVEEFTSPVIGTGFSKTPRKKLEQQSSPITSSVEHDTLPSPVDSVRLVDPPFPKVDDVPIVEHTKNETPTTPHSAPTVATRSRAGSGLGLFPKPLPLTPSHAVTQTLRSEKLAVMYNVTPPLESVKKGQALMGSSRTMKLTKLFQKKAWSVNFAKLAC